MSISKNVERAIWVSSGGRCAICRCLLLEAGATPTFLGEVAHIIAEKPNGPRGSIELSSTLSNDQANLILLCANHHTEIDKLEGEYSVEFLRQIKSDHEAWVTHVLTAAPTWTPGRIMPGYIHLHRISMLAAQAGIQIETPLLSEGEGLHSLGFGLVRLMSSIEHTLEVIRPHALKFSELELSEGKYVGALISLGNVLFRTKNCHFLGQNKQKKIELDWNKAPHIYHKSKQGFKLVLSINPRWITTSSAFTWFGGGQWRFSGLIFINNIDEEAGVIFATPLFIGTESLF